MTTPEDRLIPDSRGASRRITSIDVFRGLTILLMVFVNDLGPHSPAWLRHIQPSDADGMTVADIVFPFFLFVAGVSIPLAVERSRSAGQSSLRILLHVLARTGGLLVMGLIGVNRQDHTSFDFRIWAVAAYVFVLMAWCRVPRKPGRQRSVFLILKAVGVVGLVTVLSTFRRSPIDTSIIGYGEVRQWVWLCSQWWGILGLIAWAYLMASLLYLLAGRRREWLVAGTAMLMSMFVISQNGGFFSRLDSKPWLTGFMPALNWLQRIVDTVGQYVDIGTQLGSLAAVVCCGAVMGSILLPDSDVQTVKQRVRWAFGYAALLFAAGCFTDTFAGVNKIQATPTWCFWCCSLAVVTWIPLYVVIDVTGWRRWSVPVRITGENPLIAYLLHPIILYVVGLAGIGEAVRGYSASESAPTVIVGSAVMAAVVSMLTIVLSRIGFRIRI